MSPVGQFSCEYEKSLDDKGRVIVPAPYRQAAAALDQGEGFYLTRGLDGCIAVYTPHAYREQAQKVASLGQSRDRGVLMFQRLWMSSAQHVIPDAQGRVPIPQPLRDAARISASVVFVGMQEYFEIWSGEAWAAVKAEHEAQFDTLARTAFGAGAVGTARDSDAGNRPAGR